MLSSFWGYATVPFDELWVVNKNGTVVLLDFNFATVLSGVLWSRPQAYTVGIYVSLIPTVRRLFGRPKTTKKTVVSKVLKESTVCEVLAGRNRKISTVAIGKDIFTTVPQVVFQGNLLVNFTI